MLATLALWLFLEPHYANTLTIPEQFTIWVQDTKPGEDKQEGKTIRQCQKSTVCIKGSLSHAAVDFVYIKKPRKLFRADVISFWMLTELKAQQITTPKQYKSFQLLPMRPLKIFIFS